MGENRFEKLAEVAANEHVDKKVPLNDSIANIAENHDLNPEQIKRVVEAANVKVFQKYFKDEEREGHKNVDFDVADPKVIISRVFMKKPEVLTDPMEDMCRCEPPDLGIGNGSMMSRMPSPLDFFRDLAMDNFDQPLGGSVKTTIITATPKPGQGDRPTMVIRIKKAKANLEKKAYETSEEYTDKAITLAKQFRASGSDPKAFYSLCKEAYEHKGHEVSKVLNSLGALARQDVPTYASIKMNHGISKVAGFLNDNLREVFELQKLANEYDRYEKAATLADKQLEEM